MKCPVCSGQFFFQWGKVGTYEILKCKGCGLGITSPFPSSEELAKSNQETYQVEQRIQTYLSRQDYFERRYKQYVNKIKTFKQKGRLLDIGCNIGLFLKVARQEGFEVTGVELNKECAEYGKKNFSLDIRTEYLHEIAFPEQSFDVITLFDVLEHVPDLHGFILEVAGILKSDGLLVVQMPNLDSLMADITRSKWNWLTPPDHLYHFTPHSIIKFLEINGFKVNLRNTWEPAEEFAGNVLSYYKSKGIIGKILFKINQISNLFTLLTIIAQSFWWHKEKGGLIEIYATKLRR